MHRHQLGKRVGILLQGKKIWISELLGIFFVALFSAGLLLYTFHLAQNEVKVYRQTEQITKLKAEIIVLDHNRELLRERVAIAQLLCAIAGRSLSGTVLYELAEIVHKNSKQFGYDPLLLLAVIKVESFFKPEALGKYRSGDLSGAFGLMQLKFETAQEVAEQLQMHALTHGDLFKPEINVILGVGYLTRMISKFKSFKLGILAYNQGPGVILGNLQRNEPMSVAYYKKVLIAYYGLQRRSRQLAESQDSGPICTK